MEREKEDNVKGGIMPNKRRREGMGEVNGRLKMTNPNSIRVSHFMDQTHMHISCC